MAKSSEVLENDDSFISLDSLKNILECPVCLFQFRTTPIFRCENGHLLCKECRVKIEKCPECRILLGYSRCLTSERIVLSSMPSNLPCKFTDRGCKEQFNKEKLEKHELECTNSVAKCPMTSGKCHQDVFLLKMWEHLKVKHNVRTGYGGQLVGAITVVDLLRRESRMNCVYFSLDPIHSSYAEYHFFTNISKKGNYWHFWVYVMGSVKEAETFECKILLRPSKSGNLESDIWGFGSFGSRGGTAISDLSTQELQFKGRCVSSLLNSPLSIMEGETKMSHLVVSDSTLLNFIHAGKDGGGLQYKFSVLKLK